MNGNKYCDASKINHWINPKFYSHFFHNTSSWQNVFLGRCVSHHTIITRFGLKVKLASDWLKVYQSAFRGIFFHLLYEAHSPKTITTYTYILIKMHFNKTNNKVKEYGSRGWLKLFSRLDFVSCRVQREKNNSFNHNETELRTTSLFLVTIKYRKHWSCRNIHSP